jgi:RHS repeat-associated protein
MPQAPEQKVSARITYFNDTEKYLHSHPESIIVKNETGEVMRKRSAVYNRYGEITALKKYFNQLNYVQSKMTYDRYGNLETITDSRGAYKKFLYNEEKGAEGTFLKTIRYGGSGIRDYENSFTWDLKRGLKLSETDENNQTMKYQYDESGRIQKVFSPYDDENGVAAVEYAYHTEKDSAFWTETKNKVSFDANDTGVITTVVAVDGLGRKIKTAKTGVKTEVDGQSFEGWNVTGAIEYDSKARVVKEGQTYFTEGRTAEEIVLENEKMIRPTLTEYDALDRVVHQVLPDESETVTNYRIENEKEITEIIDAKKNRTVTEKDVRGNIVSVIRFDVAGKELTRCDYEYNELGEMLCATDAKKNEIKAGYDMLGRRVRLESTDTGKKEFFYDEAGNLIEETDSNLREKNTSIKYSYDGMNRLTKIDYPESTDVTYTYGESGDSENGANRVVRITDETGMKTMCYGLLGEVVEESRTIGDYAKILYNERNNFWYSWIYSWLSFWFTKRPWQWYYKLYWHGRFNHHHPWYGEKPGTDAAPEFEDGSYTSTMSYTSDYLGRLNYITYPDGETVSYTYDAGGQVTGVTGERNGLVTKYVERIGYDEFGQRSFIEYGNGVKTSYTYDENRRWLDAIQTTSGTKRLLQNMSYSFDKVGNVESYTNDCGNYKTTQSYSYDGLYQLVGVKGQSEYKPKWPLDISDKQRYTSRYEQSWRFDNIGNMKSKYSEKVDSGINPHTASDLNYSFENFFDENYAHRIARSDNMFFTYDANGNLINETRDRCATLEELKHDKELANGVYKLDYGIALQNQPEVETKPYSRTYIWNERNQLKSSVEGDLVVNYRYGEDGQRAVKSSVLGETLYFNNMFQMSTTAMGMRQTKHIYVGDTRIATKNNWWKDAGTDYEKYNTYWYHGDHLGSAQLVSDWHGDEYERIEYTPYGETWIEKIKSGFECINYRFTGKEQDSETGLYYYGARYLDPKYSRWLSCDPALGEYIPGAGSDTSKLPGMGGVYNTINLNLYHYAGNNPIKYTDPDGRNADFAVDDENHTVKITVPITIYGNGASDEIAKIYEDGINNAWAGDWKTTINGQEYSVNISANVTVGDEPSSPSKKDSMNYIKVDANTSRSFVTGGYKGEWRKNGRSGNTLANDNPAPHETGHLLGLDDRYHDVTVDGRIKSRATDGWENNIMGGGSSVEQRNIDGVIRALPDLSQKKSGVLKAGRMNK